jgi:acid phosphatase
VLAKEANGSTHIRDTLEWRRRLETFSVDNDEPVIAAGPTGGYDGICQPGELTDTGRQTALALGERLRHLYVNQLGFMPKTIPDGDMIYIRSTHIPRALESVQQAFTGLYPKEFREDNFPSLTIITRSAAEETFYPNDSVCRRFADLSRQYAERASNRWNHTKEMAYVSSKIQKYMPGQAPVAVDSSPRLSGILDTVNSTLGSGEATRLPDEFYDPQVRKILEHVGVEEWFAGYTESAEYRRLGIGGAIGDAVARMVENAQHSRVFGIKEVGDFSRGRGGETSLSFGLIGCHDTT